MALGFDDLVTIVDAILDCADLEEQNRAYVLLEAKLEQLRQVEFQSSVEIQRHLIVNIAKLKRAREMFKMRMADVDPLVRLAWEDLLRKMDQRIERLIHQKRMRVY